MCPLLQAAAIHRKHISQSPCQQVCWFPIPVIATFEFDRGEERKKEKTTCSLPERNAMYYDRRDIWSGVAGSSLLIAGMSSLLIEAYGDHSCFPNGCKALIPY